MTAKDLKNALLQEAVQGKLVPQIASEGNARDLLEEIRKEKLSHGLDLRLEASLAINAKSGKRKSKKETASAGSNPCDITEDEIPFDIPENWCWCRLGEICNLTSGQDLIPEQYNSQNKGIPYITGASNFSNENIIVNRWTEYARAIAEENDLLLTCKGTVGEMAFLHEKKVHIARQVMGLHFNKKIDSRYMKYFITTQINNLKSKAKSMIPGIARDDVIKLTVPLPPLAEQKRIVAAIEKFMPLIEEYGKKETQLKAINEKIGTLTKKAILQEAVQGKLVPQIAAEGNAKDLLEEIKKEKAKLIKEGKIKKEKPLPEITEDEIPFDIPENWCWCRLGEIVNKLTDGTHRTPKYVEKGIPFLSVKNLSSGKMDFDNTKFITPEEHKELYARCNPEKGDMLLTKVGTTGIPVINDSDIEFSLFVSVALMKFNHNLLDEKFFLYLLQSPLVQDQAKENTRGVGNKNWVMDAIANTMLVLPPFAEQKRIAATIEKMLPLCEKLGE